MQIAASKISLSVHQRSGGERTPPHKRSSRKPVRSLSAQGRSAPAARHHARDSELGSHLKREPSGGPNAVADEAVCLRQHGQSSTADPEVIHDVPNNSLHVTGTTVPCTKQVADGAPQSPGTLGRSAEPAWTTNPSDSDSRSLSGKNITTVDVGSDGGQRRRRVAKEESPAPAQREPNGSPSKHAEHSRSLSMAKWLKRSSS